MAKVIPQRMLRNDSGEIMRGLDRGESYIVTRNGVPVGELMPVRRRVAVPAGILLAPLSGAPRIDPTRFRKDIDELIDQDPRPPACTATRARDAPALAPHLSSARLPFASDS